MTDDFERKQRSSREPSPRKSVRIALNADVTLRRSGTRPFSAMAFDASPFGCKIEFVERPRVHDRVWIKFPEIEALESVVCWVDGFVGGVEFEKPIYPAVFDMLVANRKK